MAEGIESILSASSYYSPAVYTDCVKHCLVSIIGDDGQTHTVEVDAMSLFDAAAHAINR